MNENPNDKSEESKIKHITYYKSLSKIIKDIELEIESEKEEEKIKHLKERINAINLDKERIENMFPGISEELEND